MNEEQRRDCLREEYQILQRQYEDFDQRSLTIKGWISAAAIAAIALGADKGRNPHGEIWLAIAAIAACVWYLEGRWKTFQYAMRNRIRIIEAYFRDDPDILIKNPAPFQIYHWWFRSYANDEPIYEYEKQSRPKRYWIRLWVAMKQQFVFVPYAPIILVCIIMFALGLVTNRCA
jgi:hypothetical protein